MAIMFVANSSRFYDEHLLCRRLLEKSHEVAQSVACGFATATAGCLVPPLSKEKQQVSLADKTKSSSANQAKKKRRSWGKFYTPTSEIVCVHYFNNFDFASLVFE